MEAKGTRKRWTYSEFARLPESGSTRYEVIDDELVVTPAPTGAHQIVVSNLVMTLGVFAREHGLGLVLPSPVDVLFGEGDYFEPDVVFVRSDHAHLVGDRGIECPPDLVIEILSPSTAHRDRGIKLERYRHFGVPEYWIVDLEARAVEVWRLPQNASAADVMHDGETVPWTPVAGGPTLQVRVAEILP